jgi:hypothetical protein
MAISCGASGTIGFWIINIKSTLTIARRGAFPQLSGSGRSQDAALLSETACRGNSQKAPFLGSPQAQTSNKNLKKLYEYTALFRVQRNIRAMMRAYALRLSNGEERDTRKTCVL